MSIFFFSDNYLHPECQNSENYYEQRISNLEKGHEWGGAYLLGQMLIKKLSPCAPKRNQASLVVITEKRQRNLSVLH
jgi:hypothetical protein